MKTERVYLNENYEPVKKSKDAKWMVTRTYDENGKLTDEVWVDLKAERSRVSPF